MRAAIGSPSGAGYAQPPAAPGRTRDAGMVLLEAALAIPLLLMVALAGLGTVRLALDELGVVAAARDAAVEAARGAGEEAVVRLVRERVPGAEVVLGGDAREVRVSVSAQTSVVPGIGALGFRHQAAFSAVREPGT